MQAAGATWVQVSWIIEKNTLYTLYNKSFLPPLNIFANTKYFLPTQKYFPPLLNIFPGATLQQPRQHAAAGRGPAAAGGDVRGGWGGLPGEAAGQVRG